MLNRDFTITYVGRHNGASQAKRVWQGHKSNITDGVRLK